MDVVGGEGGVVAAVVTAGTVDVEVVVVAPPEVAWLPPELEVGFVVEVEVPLVWDPLVVEVPEVV